MNTSKRKIPHLLFFSCGGLKDDSQSRGCKPYTLELYLYQNDTISLRMSNYLAFQHILGAWSSSDLVLLLSEMLNVWDDACVCDSWESLSVEGTGDNTLPCDVYTWSLPCLLSVLFKQNRSSLLNSLDCGLLILFARITDIEKEHTSFCKCMMGQIRVQSKIIVD